MAVVVLFHILENSHAYHIIRDSDIVEQTKNVPYFIEICRNSRCYSTCSRKNVFLPDIINEVI